MEVRCQSTISQYSKRGVARSANFQPKRFGKANNLPVITLSPSPILLMTLCFKHFSFNGALIEVQASIFSQSIQQPHKSSVCKV